MLEAYNHKVAVALNGQEALKIAPNHQPEIILVDMRMPLMGGLELTKKLRSFPEFANTPIIALTAATGKDAVAEQIAAGCTDHLAKPFQSDELYAKIEKHLVKVME